MRLILPLTKAHKGWIKPGHKWIRREVNPSTGEYIHYYPYNYKRKERKALIGQIHRIPVSLIEPDPDQPRKTFRRESIKYD